MDGFLVKNVIEESFVIQKFLLPLDFQFSLIAKDERLTVFIKVLGVLACGKGEENRSQKLPFVLKMMRKSKKKKEKFVCRFQTTSIL